MRTPKYHSIPAYTGLLDLYCSGEYPDTYLYLIYGVEWVNFCSVGAKPRVSAIFGYFGGDIKLTFLLSRLNIIVFWIAQLMRGITKYRLYHFPTSFDGLH